MLVIATMAAVSCVKDINNEVDNQLDDVQLVPMTFTAVSEGNELPTKALITADGTEYSMQWKGDESISVLSASKTTAQQFDNQTTTGGKNAEFSGFAASDPTYYAVYPHNDAITLSENTINNVVIPANQTATAGTFDPNAYVAVAQSSTEEFSFKTVCAMVRFSLTDVEGVTKVTFSGNNDETLACTGNVTFNGTGIPSHAYASNASKVITLEGSFKANTDYYIVFRAGALTNGMTLTVHTASGPKNYITKSAELTGIRNKVINLGNLNERTGDNALKTGTPNDLYVAYLHGFDINICGEAVVNKTNEPNALLITKKSSTKNLKGGVYFVDPDTECSIGTGISSLVVIGRVEGTRTPLKRIAISLLDATNTTSDRLVLKNITDKDAISSHKYQLNTTETFESVIFDDCYFDIESEKALLAYANNDRKLNNFVMENCDCKINTNGYIASVRNTPIQKIGLENNVIFSDNQGTLHIIDFTGSNLAEITTVDLTSNTLYKVVAPSASQGYIKVKSISNLTVTNNLFYDCASDANHSFVYYSTVSVTNPSASHNIDSENGEKRVYIVNGNAPSGVTAPSITKFDFPLTLWKPSEGSYVIPGDYQSDYYGATR